MVQKAIGTLLKERRTKLDWSLDKAEKQTSIKKIYISALETDNYSVFPGPFYVRAYLKQYAQRLELDVDAILDAFDKGIPVEVEGPFEDTGNYRFIRPDERELLPSEEDEQPQNWFQRYLPVILLSSFAIIILIAVTAIVLINFPKEAKVLPENYSMSQSSTSSSSSPATGISHSADGASIQVKSGKNPLVLTFRLNGGLSAATVNVSGTVSQTASLTAAAPSATITLEENVTTTTLTLSDYRSLSILINEQPLSLADVPNPPNTLTLEITY
ncbi:hypothetical protein OfM1_02300 [Lactovum odontotermitis]